MNDSQSTQDILAPVIKSVAVRLPIEAAFRLFFEEINSWWPLVSHSVGGSKTVACRMEQRVGGRFYEIQEGGAQSDWGQVQVWEPPQQVVFTLHPGRAPDLATQVEVNFRPESDGTRLTLIHTHWERCGEGAAASRKSYDGGWDHVLGKYLTRVTEMSASV